MNGQSSSDRSLLTSTPLRHPALPSDIILGEPVSAVSHSLSDTSPFKSTSNNDTLNGVSAVDGDPRKRHQSTSPPPIALPSPNPRNPNEPVAQSAKRGRQEYWKMVQSGEAANVAPSPATTPRAANANASGSASASASAGGNGNGSGINLVFRLPGGNKSAPGNSGTQNEESPASSSGSAKKRRRMIEVPPNPTRASRARISSTSRSGTPQTQPPPHPSDALPPSTSTETAATPAGPLSIFAPPPSASLPEALQSVIGSSSSTSQPPPAVPAANAPKADGVALPLGDKDKQGDAIMREAGEGFESRLRSARGNDPAVRTGVSASGKGVKVGGAAAKEGGKVVKKKGKGKTDVEIPNQDFCSACRGIGKFLCCDGCPRSFHFMCLEPPFRIDELPDEETWYCKKCKAERMRDAHSATPTKDKELKPIPMVFKQLCKRVDDENPASFKLPQDVRQFFQGIATDARGNYVDAEETRTKYDRKGFQEERDGTRLRDARSRPVSCYACGGSSIPLRSLTTDPESTWRQIVSCDYCALHWHLDCLSPPLASMPNSGRKWMCPNHAEQVMARRRTVRNNLETVDIHLQGVPNNGNIQIVPEEDSREKIEYEDFVINRKKYRVPEKVIRLDFWEKLGLGRGKQVPPARGGGFGHRHSTSSLSSLGSGEDGISDGEPEPSAEDMEAANLVLSLLHPGHTDPNPFNHPREPTTASGSGSGTATSTTNSISSRPPSVAMGQTNSNPDSNASTPADTPSFKPTGSNSVIGGDVDGNADKKGNHVPPKIMLRFNRH